MFLKKGGNKKKKRGRTEKKGRSFSRSKTIALNLVDSHNYNRKPVVRLPIRL